MDEYIAYCPTLEPNEIRLAIGTFDYVRQFLLEWEEDPMCLEPEVRRCTRPINNEFVRAGIERVAMA